MSNIVPSESLYFTQMLRAVDNLTKKAIPYQQALLYTNNMPPECIEYAYKTKLLITKTYSIAHNISYLCGEFENSLHLSSYNIEFYLTSVINQINQMYENYNTKIFLNCSSDCKNVVLDIRRTSLIIFNLISNAVIHSKVKNKEIIVTAIHEGNNFVITVKDNGKGIPKSRHKELFTVHREITNMNLIKDSSGGLFNSGTGLAVSNKAANEMNGTLSLEPSASGAKFRLEIPQDKSATLGETVNFSLTYAEIEDYLSDTLLMFYLENENHK